MPEELLESVSSQGSTNPRLRNTRRVRAVPYECCGGMCSFLNSGCFTMCCGGPKIRRRSSTNDKKRRGSKQLLPKKEQISESPKRLIKPNADDGITEVDKNHYNISDAREMVENEENLSRDLYISENDVELGDIPRKENIDDEKDSAFSFNEDNASTYTDEISIAGSDVSGKKKKGKKKLINILGIGKKKKNDDGISVGTNSSSLVSSEKIGIPRPNATGVLEHPPEEIQPVLFEKCAIKSQSLQSLGKEVSDEVSTKETQEVLTTEDIANNEDEVDTKMEKISTTKKNGSKIFSIFQSKAKKADDKIEHSGENDYATEGSAQSPIDESELIQIARVIPLGADISTKKTSQSLTTEKSPETDPNQTAPEKLGDKRKKKFFWRSSSQKDKRRGSNEDEADQTDSSKNTSGKKSFLGKWGSLKRPPNSTSTQHENSPENDSTPEREDAIESITDDVGQSEEVRKKKTLFGTLRLSKKDKSEKSACEHGCRTQCTHLPSLFSACTNSNIRSESERKPSSDSIEVKTIVSYDGESGSRDSSPIRIIRNDFFPDEIHDSDKPCSVDKEENIDEIGEKHVKKQDDEINDNVGKVEKNIEILENELEGVGKQDVPLSEKQDVPLLEMQNGVINNEDAEEPLDLLKNNEDIDYKISAPVSSMCFQEIPLKNECDTENLKENEVNSENVPLPDGIFRSSCRLSIEGSIQEVDVDGSNHIQERAIHLPESALTSTDTLTQDHIDENIIEKSTETLTEDKFGSTTQEWIDAANAGDIDGPKFNNIYKATLEDFQNIEENSAPLQEENVVTDLEPAENEVKATCDKKIETSDHERRSSCETCGKILEEPEDSVAGQQEIKCVCTTLTKARPSVGDLEEGNVKNKIAAFDQSQLPIIIPLNWVGNKQEPPKKDDVTISEAHSSPTLGSKSGSKSATPSPIAAKSRSGTLSSTNSEWQNAEEDIDRLMVIQGRSSLSSLGLRSDSMASVYSGAGEGRYGTVTVRGHVEFGLQYNYKAGALEIHVKQCKDLAPVDTKRNRSDPYVKVYLLPDKSKGGKRKTKVKKHTLNPVFDETLKFHISLNGLETRTLWLTVWHSDMFGRNDFLGEVMMALENKVFDDPTPKMYSLQERTEPFDDTISFKGDIIVCLKFVPPDMTVQKKGKRSRGTLHVLVKEAKYLTAYKANGTSDPFCKSYLLPDKGRNSKQKTPVVRKTVNPVWNHTFIYDDVTLQELAERCLELTVWDHDRLASNEFLGGVRFSMGTGKHYGKPVEWMDASGKEMTLWKNMLERPNFWVEGCLSLRPTLDARTS